MNGATTNNLSQVLSLIRLPNLIFLAYLQSSLFFLFVCEGCHYSYAVRYVIIYLIPTLFITAFGYVYNDSIDQYGDLINAKKGFLKENNTPASDYLKYLIPLVILTDISTMTAAYWLRSWSFYFLLSGIAISLIAYSSKLKCLPLIGNLQVAFLCSLALALPLIFIDYQILSEGTFHFIACYLISIFLFTLLREIVKDQQDVKGDDAQGCVTLPIYLGLHRSRIIVWALLLLIILYLFWWAYSSGFELGIFVIVFGILPLIVFSFLYYSSRGYKKAVQYLKIEMIIASLLPFIFKFLSL